MKRPFKSPIRFRNHAFEFFSIFIAVIAAFALDNWNDNRKNAQVEHSILVEIRNGLRLDIKDIEINKFGHEQGLKSVSFWSRILDGATPPPDSIMQGYFDLFRDFVSIQNRSGYESLKSNGLNLIKDDSLRFHIISFYEYDMENLRKFEEEYQEMQFHENYSHTFNEIMSPHFKFDEGLFDLEGSVSLSTNDKKRILLDLWQVSANRAFCLQYYNELETKTKDLITQIEDYLKL
jgi:hypothetical protein